MPPTTPDGVASDPAAAPVSLSEWRQGDYFLGPFEFLEIDGIEDGVFAVVPIDVLGLVVITQTCDIVNAASNKNVVVVAPLRLVDARSFSDIGAGRTPSAALIEHPPEPLAVVDLNRMMTIRKDVLTTLKRMPGITEDWRRAQFAAALERKHGRFAFPDPFSEGVLRELRKRLLRAHDKPNSESGRAYRSLLTTRVRAAPHWDAAEIRIGFLFVLEDEPEIERIEVYKALQQLMGNIAWPNGYSPDSPPFALQSLDEITAREWRESVDVDWDFISRSA